MGGVWILTRITDDFGNAVDIYTLPHAAYLSRHYFFGSTCP